MKQHSHLGFPAPLLGMNPVRLPVLLDDGERMALVKPSGVLVQADPWYPRCPVLVEAIRYQAAQEKPEMARMGIPASGLWAVTDLDPDCWGPVLFTRSRSTGDEQKNLYGSGSFEFSFEFLSPNAGSAEKVECELPIARHRTEPKVLVSHTTGKQCQTEFIRGEKVGAYTLWTAKTRYPRRHQVLLHAMECGIPVLGDTLYAHSWPLYLSRLKKDYQARTDREERPLFDGPALFLKAIRLENNENLAGPQPPKWTGLLRQLTKHSGTGNLF